MPIDKIIKLLEEKIEKEKQKKERVIIFWIDSDKKYSETIESQTIETFKIVKHKKNNQFWIKKLIEIDEPETNFIVYRDEEIIENENWLIDIQKYSGYFSPDAIALLMDELEVKEPLKPYFRKYNKFFDSIKRKESFKEYYNKSMTEKELLHAFLAVVFKAKNASQYEVLKAFILEALKEKDVFREIEKYDMKEPFIHLIKNEYGADISKISINEFLEKLLLCHFDYKIRANSFKDILDMNKNSSYLAMEYLLKDVEFKTVIKPILASLEQRENLKSIVDGLPLKELIKVGTFDSIDKKIITKIITEMDSVTAQPEQLINLIYQRKSETYNLTNFKTEYNLIEAALQIKHLIKELKFDAINAGSVLKNYVSRYYKIDSLYRKFYQEYEQLHDKEEFESIQEKLEVEYINNYNRYLSEHWESHLEKNLFEGFNIHNILSQNDFYEKEIEPFVRRKNKIFVIISDALRYEAGVELGEKLAKETSEKVKVETEAMLASLPSITKIGMAALLPQKDVRYSDGEITINQISASGTANRDKILKAVVPESIAITYKDIMVLKKEELTELLKGMYVVYIYHDVIDAIGDNYKTEDKVFDAEETTIEELKNLVFMLNNKANATNIYITADHGFLYQRTPLKEYNKLEKYDFDIIEQGKRYIFSKDETDDKSLIKIDMNYLFKEQKINAYIPHRNTRIKQQGGGSKYVHGGISLQEVVIPLIRFRYMQKEIEKKQKVNVELLNTNRVIANNFIKLSFMQKEKVDTINRIFERKIVVALYDSEEMISDEKSLILDSKSDKISSREFEIQLNLKNRRYEFYKKYQVRVKDIEEDEVIESYDFEIRFNNF